MSHCGWRQTRVDDRPLRILQVVHGLSRGGLENGVINLLNGLPAADFEQAICCLDRRGELAARVASGIPIDVLGRGRRDMRLPMRLAQVIRERQPDLIHCRNWNTWPDTVLAHRLAGGIGTLIWSFHGFADGCWFPNRRRFASWLLSFATDRLFAVCRDAAERFAGVCKIPKARFDVLYNGVDCARYMPVSDRAELRRRLGFETDELVILTVANFAPVKGHAQLLRAAELVLAASDRRLRFVWLGDGPERAVLQRRLADLGLDDWVQMHGSNDDVHQFLAAADLFVLPSHLEGMSNAILEAMASGLAVVAHAVGGNPELIEHDRTGLLCADGDINALADAIGRLLANDEERLHMGRAARRRARQIFSLEAMLVRYAAFYRNSVPGTNASHSLIR